MMCRRIVSAATFAFLLPFGAIDFAPAAEQTAAVSVGEGNLTLQSPVGWKQKEPSVRIIEAEWGIPAVEGDREDGRCTIMGAGGSVQANIDRWIGQFAKTTQNKVEKKEIAGQEVHVVDLQGTYKDQRGPFAPAVLRDEYRMLGAIVVTQNRGNYFVKFYGPQATVTAHEKAFREMLESLKVK
jgi:hypothetical protein